MNIYKVKGIHIFGKLCFELDNLEILKCRQIHHAHLIYEEKGENVYIYKNYFGKPGLISKKKFAKILQTATVEQEKINQESSLNCSKL